MVIKVTANDSPTQIRNVNIGDNVTLVKKVIVGRPIRRVNGTGISVDNIAGLDTSNKTNGSVLVYNGDSSLWEATLELEKQNINGGQY